jgi:hypothetical protein
MTWAQEPCTLPTAERPLRVAEFDELFASARGQWKRVGHALKGGGSAVERTDVASTIGLAGSIDAARAGLDAHACFFGRVRPCPGAW